MKTEDSNNTLRLKSFFEEARLIAAGSYDGNQVKIMDSHSFDRLVTEHESIHARIMSETLDGQILGLLLTAQQHKLLDLEQKDHYENLIKDLFNSSEFAQEVIATYLSIKAFSPIDHYIQLNRYPGRP